MMNENLEILQEPFVDGIRFILRGRITTNNAHELEEKLEEAVNARCGSIILNMLGVDHLSSAGIKAILKTYKDMKSVNGKLGIEGPSENVRNVLGMTALDTMLIK